MICKNCGNNVQPKMSVGQIIFGVVLLIFDFIIGGILYMVFCHKRTCPVCGCDVYYASSTSSSTNESKKKEKQKSKNK